jgi:hypothetical protein
MVTPEPIDFSDVGEERAANTEVGKERRHA